MSTTYMPEACASIVAQARMIVDLRGDSPEDALRHALAASEDLARRAIAREGIFSEAMTTELLDQWRDLLGVCIDVRNGFVSPTVGPLLPHLTKLVAS